MKDKEFALIANAARMDVVRMLAQAQSGHTAGALGMADIFTFLYYEFLKVDPKQPASLERDYLFLSNGHICAIWYATLASKGFFERDRLFEFRRINSMLQGHPHMTIPGVENAGGPLGQGVGQAVGCALALQRDGRENRVVCLTGDGELEEGMCWEAFMFADKYALSNLIFIVDRNHIQIDNSTERVMQLEPLADKFRAFGFAVFEIDGHSYKEIRKALERAHKERRPSVLIAETIPGKGVSEFEGKYEWHGKPPSPEEAERALKELEAEREAIKGRWF